VEINNDCLDVIIIDDFDNDLGVPMNKFNVLETIEKNILMDFWNKFFCIFLTLIIV